MIFGFSRPTRLLEDESVLWMLDVFDWALSNLDAQKFITDTKLIYPNNECFPGREDSAGGMASLIFSQVKAYAGIESLPYELQNEDGISHVSTLETNNAELAAVSGNEKLVFRYHTHTLNNPEVLIASFIHQISYSIVTSAHISPPGGKENLPHAAELLAVFMGFGLIMANTANTQKIRSCGSCSGPAVERESFLSQYDMTYALAIFCVFKNIPVKDAGLHLKKSLRTFYKKSYKEILAKNYSHADRLENMQTQHLSNN